MIDLIQNNINAITDVCKKHHVKELFVFGSAARRTDFNNSTSDVDLLVTFETLPSYTDEEVFYLVYNKEELQDQFQGIFNRGVDLIEEKNISNKYLRYFINKDKKLIYGIS